MRMAFVVVVKSVNVFVVDYFFIKITRVCLSSLIFGFMLTCCKICCLLLFFRN